MVFYTPLNINDSRPLLQRFEQKYPFLKTELLRMSAEPLLNRVITEDRAGRNVVDVINNTVINPLKKLRLVQPYRSPEHAAYLDPFKDPDGYWASVNNNYYVLGFNTKLVSAKEAPAGLAAKAPHPNTGKLLLDFMLSYESQQQLRSANRLSGRMDIEPLVPEMHHSKLKLAAIDPKVSDDLNRYANEFREIYFR